MMRKQRQGKKYRGYFFFNCLALFCVFLMLGKAIGSWVWDSYKDCILGFIICFSYDIFYSERQIINPEFPWVNIQGLRCLSYKTYLGISPNPGGLR